MTRGLALLGLGLGLGLALAGAPVAMAQAMARRPVVPALAADASRAAPGPHGVQSELGEWADPARAGRVVPWKLYRPVGRSGPAPLIIWSHGGGGSREGSAYLGEHLASHGFAALHIQHAGSDREAFRANPRAILAGVMDPKLGFERYRDVQFVARQVAALAQGAWRGRIDPARLGISGHSYGAITTQIAAGQMVKGFGQSLAEPAFKAGFVMSPSPPRPGYDAGADSFAAMRIPLFHLTGTHDASPADDFPAIARRAPYDRTSGVDQYLLVIEGGTHMTFTGVRRGVPGIAEADPRLEENLPLVKAAAIAFWQATLLGDAAARAWLEQGGYAAFVGARGRFEWKKAAGR